VGEKIVLNLLSNAFKFTLDGEIEVSLRWAGEHVDLAVRDTGMGIAEVDLARMFQRFQRIRNARSRTHEGTGIGLALVRELARLHGGDVTVKSTEGRGSTFTVSIRTGRAHLPAERINAARQLAATTVGAASFVQEALRWLPQTGERPATGRREAISNFPDGLSSPLRPAAAPSARVFLVDDNADMRDYVGGLLARTYAVESFADGQAALERIKVEPPDLVLADVMMPHLDGFGLLRALRADERTRSLPVILLSARAGEEAVIEGHQAGADAYLTKPFSARELLGRVAAQLELARLRRDAENALRYRSTQYQTLLDQAPVGVYVVDADFRIRDVNPVALPFFGAVPGDVVGRDFDEIIHKVWDAAYANELVRIFRQTLESGDPYIAPGRAEFRRDRRIVESYEWRLDRIMLPDGRYGVVCYFRDISGQVQSRKAIEDSREALREADRRKDEFLAMLAHELRNPLGALVSAARLLDVDGQSEADVQRIRAVMGRQLDHLTHLVDDLLEVSRVITGQVRLHRRAMDFTRAVNAAVEALRARGALDRHHVTVDAHEPVWVDADETRIEQIVTNLLGNALKFTPRGGTIALEARSRGSHVTFSVKDSGVGIPAEALPRIFDLFAQGERTLDRSEGGLGIGLTVVRRLVELHRGTIEAHSDGLDQGSVFSVRLPVMAAPAAATIDASLPEPSPEPSSARQRRVLIVEDNDDARDMLRFLLEHRGHTVSVAADGHDGIEHALRTMPDVALIDIGLPGVDGYEVARRIRSADPGRRIALVALTGYGLPDDRRRAEKRGLQLPPREARRTRAPVRPPRVHRSAADDGVATPHGRRHRFVSGGAPRRPSAAIGPAPTGDAVRSCCEATWE
jgi:PAS domain S-box-containing protein